ncbi:MAG: hypothetical protein A2868_01720 [Candidatus Levybacteria bacterium RIFCSPHIGHO2_01_FULL_40_15b]|nr:MAG: hypothetical protein A2868_01720 [Candidatus Levybacteria bacterium RIFCSPHIGHO2_01_FULL_40_15b]
MVVESEVGDGAELVGQGANSQFGPVLPTDEPSGQIFTSSVQAFCSVLFKTRKNKEASPIAIKKRITEIKIGSFILGLVGGGGIAGICSVDEF